MKKIVRSLKVLPFENNLYTLPIEGFKDNKPRKVIGYCFSEVTPEQKQNPKLIAISNKAFELIDVELDLKDEDNIQILAGNLTPQFSKPLAHCYCGYQFGNWAGQLGDGRAIILGDLKGYELQLKGAGLTPYSRFADGKAVIRSSIREYLCSEAMFHLGIPTTRAGSLVITDSKADRDIFYDGHPKEENCAVILRIAQTFFRFGSFEVEIDLNPKGTLVPKLWEYCVKNYYQNSLNPFLDIVQRTAKLVAQWQCYGFCHGVLNTDNMSIVGLTIDYGPYAFIDYFNKQHISNHSDKEGRYSYENQPTICYWNLIKLCEALSSVFPISQTKQIVNNNYWDYYNQNYYHIMLRKLGIMDEFQNYNKSQQILVDSLFNILNQSCTNYTKVFIILQQLNIPYQDDYAEEIELNENDKDIIQQLLALRAPIEILLKKRKPFLSKQQIIQYQGLAQTSPQLLTMLGINEEFIQMQIKQQEEYTKLQESTEENRIHFLKLLWEDWILQYKSEPNVKNRQDLMNQMNPKYTLTNSVLQKVIFEVENNQNYDLLQKVQNVIENPFVVHQDMDQLFNTLCDEEICVSCSS